MSRRLPSMAHRGSRVRQEKVSKVREAIEAGAYENELKFQIALDRMIEAVERELPRRPGGSGFARRACA